MLLRILTLWMLHFIIVGVLVSALNLIRYSNFSNYINNANFRFEYTILSVVCFVSFLTYRPFVGDLAGEDNLDLDYTLVGIDFGFFSYYITCLFFSGVAYGVVSRKRRSSRRSVKDGRAEAAGEDKYSSYEFIATMFGFAYVIIVVGVTAAGIVELMSRISSTHELERDRAKLDVELMEETMNLRNENRLNELKEAIEVVEELKKRLRIIILTGSEGDSVGMILRQRESLDEIVVEEEDVPYQAALLQEGFDENERRIEAENEQDRIVREAEYKRLLDLENDPNRVKELEYRYRNEEKRIISKEEAEKAKRLEEFQQYENHIRQYEKHIRVSNRLLTNMGIFSSEMLLCIVLIGSGILGSIVSNHRIRDSQDEQGVNEDKENKDQVGDLLSLRPLLFGISSGFISFLAIRGGKTFFIIEVQQGVMLMNPFSSAFIALLAGLFTDMAFNLLKKIAKAGEAKISSLLERPENIENIIGKAIDERLGSLNNDIEKVVRQEESKGGNV